MKCEDVKKHIEVEFPSLEKRVAELEKEKTDIIEIQVKVNAMEKTLDDLGRRVEKFFTEMRDAYTIFIEGVRNSNITFVRWLIGTVLLSLITGLYFQYRSFHEVNSSIYNVEKKMNKSLHELEKKIIINQK